MGKRNDLTGEVFGKLKVIEAVGIKQRCVMWNCECECGNFKEVKSTELRSGNTKSCGCGKRNDIHVGQRFSRLEVVEEIGRRFGNHVNWLCKCDCGRTIEVISSRLKTQKTTQCYTCSHKYEIEPGTRFGRWRVLGLEDQTQNRQTKHLCVCDCGKTKPVFTNSLLNGRSQSCGCLQKEGKYRETHGLSHTRLYTTWEGMKSRCDNPKNRSYKHYGGRGISYISDWGDFSIFSTWVLSNGYKDNLTIERKDVNGNYDPGNVTFIPKSRQSHNRRDTVKMEFLGEIKSVVDWSNIFGISPDIIKKWKKKGLTLAEGLEKRKRDGVKEYSKIVYNGETKTIHAWSKEFGINFNYWFTRGLSFEEIIKIKGGMD